MGERNTEGGFWDRAAEEGKAEPRPGGLRSIEQAVDVKKLALKKLAYHMVNEWFREAPQRPIAELMMDFHHAAAQAPTAQSAPPPAGPESPPVSLRPGGKHWPTCPYSPLHEPKNAHADCNCDESYEAPPLEGGSHAG